MKQSDKAEIEISSVLDILHTQAGRFGGAAAEPVFVAGQKAGFVYEDDFARYCSFAPILPADITLSRNEQAEQVLELMTEALAGCGMAFTDIVRTWFYLDKLLDWYDDFNRVRTRFFEKHGTFDHLVPASTGIGAPNPEGSALIAGLIAIKPKIGSVTIRAVQSPMQGSAMDYRSSFSRAVEIATPYERSLLISGTASIDGEGRSVHIGDAGLQIQKTLDVVTALLESRQMTWRDAFSGVVYYPDASHHELFLDCCRERGIVEFPVSILESDVCRPELLFELELEARKATAPPSTVR